MRPQPSNGLLFGLLLLLVGLPRHVIAQVDSQRVVNLESRVSSLEHSLPVHADEGVALFLFGAFCALWAQNIGRNPWLWFFLGLFFNVLTVLVLLHKNSRDRSRPPAQVGS